MYEMSYDFSVFLNISHDYRGERSQSGSLWCYVFLSVWYSMPIVMEIGRKHRIEQVWACI